MSVYVTGDIHGYPIRLTEENLQKIGVSLTKEDKLLICGDFGLPWYNDEEELQCIEWLAKKPFEILFIESALINISSVFLLKTCSKPC